MTWGMQPPHGHGTVGPKHDGWMAQFLRKEAAGQAEMLARLRARLEKDLERAEQNQALPGEEFVRVARLYQDGYRHLAQLELETAKVRLLALKAKDQPMTDDQFNAQIAQLGRQALDGMSDEELAEYTRSRRTLAIQSGEPEKETR